MKNANTPTDNLIRSTQDIYRYRLAPFVQKRIAEAGNPQDNPFLQKYPLEQWLTYLIVEMQHLPFEQFLAVPDHDLKQRIGGLMSLELVAGMLNDLTSEQLKTFDECLMRH
jgi:hypothetical protein